MLAAAGSLVAAIWTALHPRALLLAVVTFLLLADFFKNRRPKNFPPGPWSLPFVGNIFQLDFQQPHLSIQPVGRNKGVWLCPYIILSYGNRRIPGNMTEDQVQSLVMATYPEPKTCVLL